MDSLADMSLRAKAFKKDFPETAENFLEVASSPLIGKYASEMSPNLTIVRQYVTLISDFARSIISDTTIVIDVTTNVGVAYPPQRERCLFD